MCGIAGIVCRGPNVDVEPVQAMQRALQHRGPNSKGNFVTSHIALCSTRLAIIDVTSGHQPLYNEDDSIVLVANAEIYNFVELRIDLENKGHQFRTGSDCEVIIHLYEEYGEDFARYLRGMFALALWDVRRKKLVLARDRMGEKPLYIYETRKGLVFASEMKALLSSGLIDFRLDPNAVNLYFHFHYVPEPRTLVQGIDKLPAAHTLTINIEDWESTPKRYWSIDDIPPKEGDPVTAIRGELETVARLVVRSDVPVGVGLSGGLDSSAIAFLTAKTYPGKLQAFCVGYEGQPDCDERKQARATAEHLNIPFHEVEIANRDIAEGFPKLVSRLDDPIADISSFSYDALMRKARQHNVQVIMQGQGGDELFWGYPWVREAVFETARKDRLIAGGGEVFTEYLNFSRPQGVGLTSVLEWLGSLGGFLDGLEKYHRDRSAPVERPVFLEKSLTYCRAKEKIGGLFHRDFSARFNEGSPLDIHNKSRPWPSSEILVLEFLFETYLRENGLTQGDRLSMASSVELRLPLVDHKLVETVLGLRKVQSDLNHPPKAWFREAVSDLIPDWILNRPKAGFSPPTEDWFKEIFSMHGDKLIDGYLTDNNVLDSCRTNRFAAGPSHGGTGVPLSFKALVLEQWCRNMEGLVGSARC